MMSAWRKPGPAFLAVVAAAVVGIAVGFSKWNSPPNAQGTRSTAPDQGQADVAVTSAGPLAGLSIAAAGDLSCEPGSKTEKQVCHQVGVSSRVLADPTIALFLPLGDNQYEKGALTSYQAAYAPSYGRLGARTHPVPGNHEYNTENATGYFAYFATAAGDPAKGYYSYDIGTRWHAVALNSNCDSVACGADSAQVQWLRSDLGASKRPCTIAYWHHPRFSSGTTHGGSADVAAFWSALYQGHADIVLNGHEHNYERFDPQSPTGSPDANGVREFVVGTGGASLYPLGAAKANSAARVANTFGFLKLTLGERTYQWRFVAEDGKVLDRGTGSCH